MSDGEALTLLRHIAASVQKQHRQGPPRGPSIRRLSYHEQLKYPEVACVMRFFLQVKELSKKVTAPQATKTAVELIKNIQALIEITQGRLSEQIIADIQREMFRVCMSEVIGSTAPLREELALPDTEQKEFAEAEAALKKLDSDPQQGLSEEDCKAYLVPFESLYLTVTESDLSQLLPSIPPIPHTTKGEWFHCPARHIYFEPASYQEKKKIPPCPECS